MKGLIISRIEALRGGASGFGFAACAAICVFALGLTGCEFIRDFMGIGGEEPPQPAMVSGPAIRIDSPDPEGGPGWSFDDNTVTIAKNGVYTIQGGTTVNRVKVSSGVKANIVLDGVDIDLSAGSADECAFDITGAAVELIFALGSTNTLKSNGTSAGLHVPAGAALTITSAAGGGTLSAAGGNSGGAGIGGGNGEDGGTITISGGTVNATGGTGGAGIGGGKGDNSGSPTIVGGGGGNITISGGTVSATGGDGEGDVKHANYHQPGTGTSGGSGIGGGSFGPGGTITIRGGFVWAYSPASSGDSPTPAGPSPGDTDDPNGDPPAIGGGSVSGSDGDAGTITISGGTVIAVTESRGAAIGGGKRAKNGSISISGGTIIALYRPGLGPYGGTTNTQSGYDESNDGTIGLDS
ncbi:MAG: hypothetical protein LBG27_04590, partial [Spirochaetaceae bacterium]|nr:hypothetical protein [Spirochaetaceae bacterium]